MNTLRAVLFDLDGTFADTAPDLGGAVNRLRAEHGLEPLAIGIMRARASSGARGLLNAGFGLTPESEGYRVLRDRFLELYAEKLCVETRLFDGIPELLAAIEARKLPWGIVTNKAKRFTEPLLERLGFGKRAACVVSGDSTPHIKPHPAPLELAAALLRLPTAACLYSATICATLKARAPRACALPPPAGVTSAKAPIPAPGTPRRCSPILAT